MAEIVEKIKKLGERYNSSLAKIGELMTEIAEELKALPYRQFRVGNLVWKRDCLSRSPLRAYGPRFEWEPEGLIDPRGPNREWYHAGDFNCYLRTASPRGYREAARALPEFLAELRKTLSKESFEAEELVVKLEKALQTLKN